MQGIIRTAGYSKLQDLSRVHSVRRWQENRSIIPEANVAGQALKEDNSKFCLAPRALLDCSKRLSPGELKTSQSNNQKNYSVDFGFSKTFST